MPKATFNMDSRKFETPNIYSYKTTVGLGITFEAINITHKVYGTTQEIFSIALLYNFHDTLKRALPRSISSFLQKQTEVKYDCSKPLQLPSLLPLAVLQGFRRGGVYCPVCAVCCNLQLS